MLALCSGVLAAGTATSKGTVRINPKDGAEMVWVPDGWDVATLQRVFDYKGDVNAVAFTPNGKLMAVALSGGTVYVYKLRNDQIVVKYDSFRAGSVSFAEGDGIYTLAFAPDNRTLIVGGQDCLERWDVLRGKPIWRHRQRDYTYPKKYGRVSVGVNCLSVSPRMDLIAGVVIIPGSCADGTEVRLWSYKTGKIVSRPTSYHDVYETPANSVAFLNISELLVDDLGTMTVLGAYDGKVRRRLKHSETDLSQEMTLSVDRRYAAIGAWELYELWDMRLRRLICRRSVEATYGADTVSLSPDTRLVVTSADTGTGYRSDRYRHQKLESNSLAYQIGIWESRSGRLLQILPGGRLAVFAPKGNLLVTGGTIPSESRKLRVWLVKSGIRH